MVSEDFWKGKRVLVTGHTGFKGGWLSLWLEMMGAQVSGIGLDPNTNPNLFDLAEIFKNIDHHILDIRKPVELNHTVQYLDPEIVFHLAAQPLVRPSYKDPLNSFKTNVMGTVNLLEALRSCQSVKVIVVITTDKVYENLEVIDKSYKETDHLGGHDPYSTSKAAAELVTQSYRRSFFEPNNVSLATARAGNVIGGGDWSEDRLIPDAIKAWDNENKLEIRSPDSVRPWQHVLDPLAGYLILAQKMWNSSDYNSAWNFGPDKQGAVTVREIVELAKSFYGKGEIHFHKSNHDPHEANLLSLDVEKAGKDLGVRSHWNIKTSVEKTMDWYQRAAGKEDARELCLQQINEFQNESV